MRHHQRLGLLGFVPLAATLLSSLPLEYQNTTAKWAYLSYGNPSMAVIPGHFNRSVFVPLTDTEASDPKVAKDLNALNSTDFVAYDERFFDLLGPDAKIRRLHDLPFQTHEAPCYNSKTKDLFFIEWGPPGGDNGFHDWQYLLNTETNKLRKVTTNPPIHNVHGCAVYDGNYYVITDGSYNETASLNRITPKLEKSTLLNNFYGLSFSGLNDIDVDDEGNFWMTDDHYGWGARVVEYTPPTLSTVYFVNKTTLRPRPFHTTDGQANGITFHKDEGGKGTIYISNTAASQPGPAPHKLNPYGPRRLTAFDASYPGAVVSNERLAAVPIAFVYDGIKVSKSGIVFAGSGNGVDIIDPLTGDTLGTIRVGGGKYIAVNMALGEKELWIVGAGGVWHVTGFRETLARGF
ncbi:calcium-dependent phosphotriesterase [Fusarium austroafricanum]|uniref:Calcium-dependent phosphotriesterase n=1 Tax=Fusarium austroafricanum TaxID=2364996 RepID=A0A8H4NUG5_9HYPO|nr:calcium-dependent phosphotriesterase [Fusarium austroafricanum]